MLTSYLLTSCWSIWNEHRRLGLGCRGIRWILGDSLSCYNVLPNYYFLDISQGRKRSEILTNDENCVLVVAGDVADNALRKFAVFSDFVVIRAYILSLPSDCV